MCYHPRIETADHADFITSRTVNSALWFVNNRPLEDVILGYIAKYSERHTVSLYAAAIEGNHIHLVTQFTKGNRGAFMQVLNSTIARALPRYTNHPGGPVFARRYSNEFLPAAEDLENWFFYTVLQPIQDGLVERLSDYNGYNCFQDAIWGRDRTYHIVNWTAYNEAKRWRPEVKVTDFLEAHTLRYMRLPGYEELSQKEYVKLMKEKLEVRRQEILAARRAEGKGFAGPSAIRKTVPGSFPSTTKTSTQHTHRPRVLSVCPKRRAETLAWYFRIYYAHQAASYEYRNGNLNAGFPPGTYKPYVPER